MNTFATFREKNLDKYLVDVVVDLINLFFEFEVHHVEVSLVYVQMRILPEVSAFVFCSSSRQVKGCPECLFNTDKLMKLKIWTNFIQTADISDLTSPKGQD